jgi:hypothetical protein
MRDDMEDGGEGDHKGLYSIDDGECPIEVVGS